MVYLALLRGVNVGGSRKVDMKQLKAAFEEAGMTSVKTYINSGNVIFSCASRNRTKLTTSLEVVTAERFGFPVSIVLRDIADMRSLVGSIPKGWKNDQTTRCEVLFLWKKIDKPSIVTEIGFKPEIEELRYVPGALIWHMDRRDAGKSGLRLIGTENYRNLTIRNCNTVNRLLELMEEVSKS